jgi:uncharacterized protein (DUF302 family)
MSGLTVVPSSLRHAEAVARLIAAIEDHGLALLARVDHSAGARAAGLELPSEEVLFFGNAAAGTPLMQSDPRVGLDLPLHMLVWQDPEGTRLAYHDPRELSQAYDLAGRDETLEKMNALLGQLAAAAAGQGSRRSAGARVRRAPGGGLRPDRWAPRSRS